MPNLFDLALALLFAVIWPLYTFFIEWPAHKRRIEAGDPEARVRLYRKTFVQEWTVTLGILALTVWFARPVLTTLGLVVPHGWRLVLGIAIPVAYSVLLKLQLPAIVNNRIIRARLRERIAPLAPLIPTRPAEWQWFRPLAVSAGICEEIMFRGYLVWLLQTWLGLYGAAAVSVVIFGLAHGYQGGKFGTRAFLAGLGMQVLALATGSILPGIVLHALIDLGSGYVTYLVMSEPVAEATAAA